jgi:hypothetical protein
VARSGRSLVRRCQLWANLEEQNVRTAGPSSQGILELVDLRKPTARITFLPPPLSSSNLSAKKSLAAISPFIVLRASPPPVEMAWSAAASRSTEEGPEAWGAAGGTG